MTIKTTVDLHLHPDVLAEVNRTSDGLELHSIIEITLIRESLGSVRHREFGELLKRGASEDEIERWKIGYTEKSKAWTKASRVPLKGTQTLRKKLQELLVRNDLNDLPGALPAGNAACPEALQGTVQSKAFYQSSPDSAKAEPTASTLKPSASADLPKARTV